ncbi:hypothetical protein EG68_03070 [Paragonimus skrjabini miyazakii]|uniref:Uncharacterized protein n=1 Tax=Paragonimus skrjabini miyazakii TaxID=59628 RepID=A0A8S9YYW1_9TREM|nr:hypothetical protein EG68_03070 [Paragonimus skrjabini miyazakii]
MFAIVIYAVTKAVVVVPASWVTGGKLLKWPKCSAHQRTQYRVKGTKYDGSYQEHTVHIYGIYETYGEARAHVSEAITESDGVASNTTMPMTHGPKRLIDTPPEGNSAALAGYRIIDVDLPPNPQLINTSSPVISPRLIQPIGFRPHSVLTEQRLFSPIHIPSSSFLQPIPSTSAYTQPALCNDHNHQQPLPSIKEKPGRMSELLQYIAKHVTQLSSSQSYMPQHIKGSAPEKGSQALSSLSAVRTDADFEVLEDFLSEDSDVKCFVQCMNQLGGTSEGELLRNILSRNIHGNHANRINVSGLNGKRALKSTRPYECIRSGFHIMNVQF